MSPEDDLVTEIPETLPAPTSQEIAAAWVGLEILFPVRERKPGTNEYPVVAWTLGRVRRASAKFGRVDLVVVPRGGEGEVRVSAARVKFKESRTEETKSK